MKEVIKIGRYYYKRIPQDRNGEPKIKESFDNLKLFILTDNDGEPIEYLERIKIKKKKKMKKYKINWNMIIMSIIFISGLLLVSYSSREGGLLREFISEKTKIELIPTNEILYSTCENLCIFENYDYGYDKLLPDCMGGEMGIKYGYTGELPILDCCCGYEGLDSDGDGFTNEEEEQAGTNPNDPNDYPGSDNEEQTISYTCGLNGLDEFCSGTCPTSYECAELEFANYDACACISGSEVHQDWKPDGIYHFPKQNIIPTISYNCLDGDSSLPLLERIKTNSFCTDDFGSYTDYCDGIMVHDWYCIDNVGSYECSDATAWNCESYCGDGSSCVNGACTTPINYYDIEGAEYWIHFDYLANGSPPRMRGKFTTWSFITSSSGTGSETYSDIRVSFGGKQITISTQSGTKFDYNLDSFMNQFNGQSGTIKFEELFSNGYVRDRSEYSGNVDMS